MISTAIARLTLPISRCLLKDGLKVIVFIRNSTDMPDDNGGISAG
jgi:hypothetical protein